jgi:membrane protease YdiL (CAAX protease family)
MLQKYSKFLIVLTIPIWVSVSFYAAQALILGVFWILNTFNILSVGSINDVLLNAISTVLVYVTTLLIAIGVPWLVKKHKTSLTDLGLGELPTWIDILITPAGLIVYLVSSSLLLILATNFLPSFDANQVQEVGFSHMSQRYEFILAFVVLVVAVPFAEEMLFRGFLFGKLKKISPIWLSILITSILFAMLHGAWNVALDTFALSIVLCILRQITGSLWPAILLHMAKNGIAFYFLFINTSFLTTLGR